MGEKRSVKGILVAAIKWAVVIGALGYLIFSGKLDWSDLRISAGNLPWIALAASMLLTVMLASIFRYYLLLGGVGIDLAPKEVVRIGLIGYFFNTFMFGGLGGDAVKVAYVIKSTGKRAGALASVMVDRAIGLVAIMAIGGMAMALSYHEVMATPELHDLAVVTFALLFGISVAVLVGVLALVRGRKWAGALLALVALVVAVVGSGALDEPWALAGKAEAAALLRGRLAAGIALGLAAGLFSLLVLPSCQPGRRLESFVLHYVPGGRHLMRLIQAVLMYRDHSRTLALCFLLSLGLHLCNLGSLYVISRALPLAPRPELLHILFAAPLSFLVNSVPVPGGGLGVGENALDFLLGQCRLRGQAVDGGAEIFLVWRFLMVLLGLIGLPLYLRGRKEIDAADKAYEAEESARQKGESSDALATESAAD